MQDPPKELTLVQCVQTKRDSPCKAKDMYISVWFLKVKRYLELQGNPPWMILSSYHGCLDPEQVIEPYQDSLYGKSLQERKSWASLFSSQSPRSRPLPRRD